MLFQIEKVPDSGLYGLNEVLQNFYNKLIVGDEFDECFYGQFQPVLDASAKTEELFQAVFDQYAALTPAFKSDFKELYDNHLDLARCFDDITLPILEPSVGLNNIWKSCKTLGGYLYSTTMGLDCFTCVDVANTSMHDHFETFRNLNGSVCCFCGLEDYMTKRMISSEFGNEGEKQWRASYDHYLAKKHYPFLSVDFDNLFPCCQTCNEKAKGEIDLLKREGQRWPVLHPVNDAQPAALVAEYDEDKPFEDKWNIGVLTDFSDLNSFKKEYNWNTTFDVSSRATRRANDHMEASYLPDILVGHTNVEGVRQALDIAAQRARSRMKENRESYLKALCFDKLAESSHDHIEALRIAANAQYSDRSLD